MIKEVIGETLDKCPKCNEKFRDGEPVAYHEKKVFHSQCIMNSLEESK